MSGLRVFSCERLPLGQIVEELGCCGATSLPLLDDSFRQALLAEANGCRYRLARPVIGKPPNHVYQHMEYCDTLSSGSLYRQLSDEFQTLLDVAVASAPQAIFSGRVIFNDHMLQRYRVGESGISPHRDRTTYRYLVCLFVIAGYGRLYVCRDRRGAGAREIHNVPGDVILIRAPGFNGSDERPFHYLVDIRETRYVFGLRHDQSKLTGRSDAVCV